MADPYRPATQYELDTRNRWLRQNHDLFPPEFKDWIVRLIEDRGPSLLASSLSGVGSTVNDFLPWTIDVDVFPTAVSQTNWDSTTLTTSAIYNGFKVSSGTVGDLICFDVSLPAGVWTFELMHVRANDRGIYTVGLSTTGDIGTIDGYQAVGTTYNLRSQLSGVNVGVTGKQRLTLSMKTKNAGSASYVGAIQAVKFMRTA